MPVDPNTTASNEIPFIPHAVFFLCHVAIMSYNLFYVNKRMGKTIFQKVFYFKVACTILTEIVAVICTLCLVFIPDNTIYIHVARGMSVLFLVVHTSVDNFFAIGQAMKPKMRKRYKATIFIKSCIASCLSLLTPLITLDEMKIAIIISSILFVDMISSDVIDYIGDITVVTNEKSGAKTVASVQNIMKLLRKRIAIRTVFSVVQIVSIWYGGPLLYYSTRAVTFPLLFYIFLTILVNLINTNAALMVSVVPLQQSGLRGQDSSRGM
jgi:Pyruvate/2-oxoacid:ferredoxin oxidoreductase delta subunit